MRNFHCLLQAKLNLIVAFPRENIKIAYDSCIISIFLILADIWYKSLKQLEVITFHVALINIITLFKLNKEFWAFVKTVMVFSLAPLDLYLYCCFACVLSCVAPNRETF